MGNYLAALRHWRFGLVWTGLTLSSIGDGLSRLALIWLAYHLNGSATDVGLLITFYSAPVVVGGPLAGYLLDRIGPRRAMLIDNLVRGTCIGLLPVLFHVGALRPWHLFAVAAVYGFLKMITLAGAPTLLPAILPEQHLNTANALEMVSYSFSSIIGPSLAGLLLAVLSGADVLLFDAVSYLVLVGCLLAIGPVTGGRAAGRQAAPETGLRPAIRFSAGNAFLRNSTLMYMLLNVGKGVIDVLVPVLILESPGGSSTLLGLVSAATAAGQLVGSFLSGAVRWRLPYERLIAVSLALGGLPLLAFGLSLRATVLALALGASALITAPLTVWAQTVRMRLIPPEMRGSVFALLRTVMQSGPALGGLLGARMVGWLPGMAVVGLALLLVSGPGLGALFFPGLLPGDTPDEAAPAA